jgi:hypothetical protein
MVDGDLKYYENKKWHNYGIMTDYVIPVMDFNI